MYFMEARRTQYYTRHALMLDATTQTEEKDFMALEQAEIRHHQMQRGKTLKDKVEEFKADNLRREMKETVAVDALLCLAQQPLQNKVNVNNVVDYNGNSGQQLRCNGDKPIVVPVPEDDDSGDSGRLVIVLTPEENPEINNERETKLKDKVEEFKEENLRREMKENVAVAALLCLAQQPLQNKVNVNNVGDCDVNTGHQLRSNGDKPIVVPVPEDDDSGDSGRLVISLTPEENAEINNEHNNSMTMQHKSLESAIDGIFIPYKKRKFAAAQEQEVLPTNLNNQLLEPPGACQPSKKRKWMATQQNGLPVTNSNSCSALTRASFNKIQQIVPSQTSQSGEINLSNIPEMQSNANNRSPNIQTIPIQNVTPLKENNNNLSQQSAVSAMSQDDIATTSGKKFLGPNNTFIACEDYESINWSSPSNATRKLLSAKFTRKVLATHSLTGKPSPAFLDRNKPAKQMLDRTIVEDIIYTVTRKCNVSRKEVRNAITSKCADEAKIMRQNKKKENKEN